MYQNSLGMMPSVVNTDPILSVLYTTATAVPNVPTTQNVPKMTMNHPSVSKSYLVHQQKLLV